jgi:hypothetical protein
MITPGDRPRLARACARRACALAPQFGPRNFRMEYHTRWPPMRPQAYAGEPAWGR